MKIFKSYANFEFLNFKILKFFSILEFWNFLKICEILKVLDIFEVLKFVVQWKNGSKVSSIVCRAIVSWRLDGQ